jgi:hypothetical protein
MISQSSEILVLRVTQDQAKSSVTGVSTSKKKNIDVYVFFYAIYRKCASMSSDVSVIEISIFLLSSTFLTLHHKAYNLI